MSPSPASTTNPSARPPLPRLERRLRKQLSKVVLGQLKASGKISASTLLSSEMQTAPIWSRCLLGVIAGVLLYMGFALMVMATFWHLVIGGVFFVIGVAFARAAVVGRKRTVRDHLRRIQEELESAMQDPLSHRESPSVDLDALVENCLRKENVLEQGVSSVEATGPEAFGGEPPLPLGEAGEGLASLGEAGEVASSSIGSALEVAGQVAGGIVEGIFSSF